MKTCTVNLRDHVYDTWWPWKLGRVTRVTKSTIHLMWSDGTKSIYDKAHQQFLRAYRAKKSR